MPRKGRPWLLLMIDFASATTLHGIRFLAEPTKFLSRRFVIHPWYNCGRFAAKTIQFLPRDAMHKRGYCPHAVSVCLSVRLSVTFVSCAKTNKDIFEFSSSGSQAILVFPCQTGWRYSDGNPFNGGVECRWGIGTHRDSGLIAGYRRLLDMRSAKNIYRRRSWVYDQSATVGHAPLAIDRLPDVRTTKWQKQLYRRPCSVDRTVGDAPANVCLWRPAAWTNMAKRREQKRI